MIFILCCAFQVARHVLRRSASAIVLLLQGPAHAEVELVFQKSVLRLQSSSDATSTTESNEFKVCAYAIYARGLVLQSLLLFLVSIQCSLSCHDHHLIYPHPSLSYSCAFPAAPCPPPTCASTLHPVSIPCLSVLDVSLHSLNVYFLL